MGIKNNKYLVLALIFALFNAGAIFFIFGAQKYGDSQDYIEVINWFRGEPSQITPWRLLRPLGPLMAAPFEFLGKGSGLVLENIIFYLLSAILIFKITELIYGFRRQALFASIFFVTATPVIEFGLSYLVDMGGWFFYLLSIYLTLLYFKNKNERLIAINGLLSGIGVFMKETAGLGVIFFGLMVLFSGSLNIKEKIFKIARFGAFFLVPFALIQVLIFRYFHITFLDWYLMGTSRFGEGLLLVFLRYLGQLFRVLGALWPLVLIGIWQELREKNLERIKIFLALIPSSFSFLLWTFGGGGRVAFIFAPLGIVLASYGLYGQKNKLGIALFLSAMIILNYYFSFINPKVAFVDEIAKLLGLL
ncbi:MAG: glycosyltransferase family 39 protein [Candidatus Nealsonbacteria bacterium]|nr:glycosyltransferase family 39 protein [Candidatus Nealsonbacteria bacterium]